MNSTKSLLICVGTGNSTNQNTVLSNFVSLLDQMNIGIDIDFHEMPGHGKQDTQITDINDWASELFQRILKYSHKNIFILGISLGGHIVYRIMDLYNKSTEAKSNKYIFPIVQGSPPSGLENIPQYVPIDDITKDAINYLAKRELNLEEATKFVTCQFTEEFRKDFKNKSLLDTMILDAMKTKYRDKFVGSLFADKKFNELKTVETYCLPILMIHGKYDAGVNPKYLDKVSTKTLYQNKYHVIDGSHQLILSNCNDFISLIHNYIIEMSSTFK
jgi:surfactin synthase thioesterase subunit